MGRTKTSSTSTTQVYSSANNLGNTYCPGCPQLSTSASSSTPIPTPNLTRELLEGYSKIQELQKEIEKLKREHERSRSFYEEIGKLSKVSRIAIILLMIVPMLQLVACTVIVHYLGIQEQLHSLLNWVLSGVSLLSVLEMIVGGIKLYLLEHKVDELKEKVEATQEENHLHNN